MISSATTKPHKPGNFLGVCPHCGRPVHDVRLSTTTGPYPSHGQTVTRIRFVLRHNPIPRTRVIPDRERTNCSKCNKAGAWYDFKPGSGECVECQS